MKGVFFYFVSTLMVFSIFSCTKNTCCDTVPSNIKMLVYDSNENNLLSTTKDSIEFNNIKLYYLVNGEENEVYESHLDNPRRISIDSSTTEWILSVYPNTEADDKTITYIEWNDSDRDTITCSFNRDSEDRPTKLKDVWYNGKKKYPNEAIDSLVGAFKIVK